MYRLLDQSVLQSVESRKANRNNMMEAATIARNPRARYTRGPRRRADSRVPVRQDRGDHKTGKNPFGRLDAHQEKEIIVEALAESKGRIAGPAGAAAKLGVPRTTLESKIRALGINKRVFES